MVFTIDVSRPWHVRHVNTALLHHVTSCFDYPNCLVGGLCNAQGPKHPCPTTSQRIWHGTFPELFGAECRFPSEATLDHLRSWLIVRTLKGYRPCRRPRQCGSWRHVKGWWIFFLESWHEGGSEDQRQSPVCLGPAFTHLIQADQWPSLKFEGKSTRQLLQSVWVKHIKVTSMKWLNWTANNHKFWKMMWFIFSHVNVLSKKMGWIVALLAAIAEPRGHKPRAGEKDGGPLCVANEWIQLIIWLFCEKLFGWPKTLNWFWIHSESLILNNETPAGHATG